MRKTLAIAALLACLCSCCAAATYHVSRSGNDANDGSPASPFRTIQRAVDALQPGDTAVIGPGIYRESITIDKCGAPDAPITLAAELGAHVVITGADRLDNAWTRSPNSDIYTHDWPHVFAINWRNSKPILTHPNDKQHQLVGRTEQVVAHGRLLRQVLTPQQLAPGAFCADVDAHKLYVWLSDGGDPAKADLEASTRPTWLVGSGSFIHIRGLTFRHAANFAQRGAFALRAPRATGGTRASASQGATGSLPASAPPSTPQSWLIEDCTFEQANGPAASFFGHNHTIRRCIFQDNGQLGFGASYCHDTLVQDCGIYRNNTKGYSTGWEAGGLKVCLSRSFVFDHCRAVDNRGCGIWYDIGNEKSEVKNCYIADNDEAGIFYEISYGLHAHDNLIVNNANLGETPGGAWGCGGITLSSSEDCIVEHNTLVGNRDGVALREQDRSTPRIDSRQSVRILNRNHIIRNNIIAYSQAYNIAFWLDTNFFGPHPSGGDANRKTFEDPATLNIRLANNLLCPLANRPNYLYGAAWRSKSKKLDTPESFTAASNIPDSSKIADPQFQDPTSRNFTLRESSPAMQLNAGPRPTTQSADNNMKTP